MTNDIHSSNRPTNNEPNEGCRTQSDDESFDLLEEKIVLALKTVYDPEIPVNIYEMGLIYDISFTAKDAVEIKMTLTSPACPVAGTLPGEVEGRVAAVDGVSTASVEVVWDPVWSPSMMSEAARLELGMF